MFHPPPPLHHKVYAFYAYWEKFDSWRDFSMAKEQEHDPDSADSREEKRWMIKENMKGVKNMKKKDNPRIITLVERAAKRDPRLTRAADEAKAAKAAAKAAKQKAKDDAEAAVAAAAAAEAQSKADAEAVAKEAKAGAKAEKEKVRGLRAGDFCACVVMAVCAPRRAAVAACALSDLWGGGSAHGGSHGRGGGGAPAKVVAALCASSIFFISSSSSSSFYLFILCSLSALTPSPPRRKRRHGGCGPLCGGWWCWHRSGPRPGPPRSPSCPSGTWTASSSTLPSTWPRAR